MACCRVGGGVDAIRSAIKVRLDRARSATLTKVGDPAVADMYGHTPQHLRASVVDAGLEPDMADIIMATRVEGHRLTDQADGRGIPAATLRQRRYRAERRLRTQLAAA